MGINLKAFIHQDYAATVNVYANSITSYFTKEKKSVVREKPTDSTIQYKSSREIFQLLIVKNKHNVTNIWLEVIHGHTSLSQIILKLNIVLKGTFIKIGHVQDHEAR